MKNQILILAALPQMVPEMQPGAPAPTEFRILPLGDVPLVDNRPGFRVEPEDLAAIVVEFAARDLDLVIDYEHQTLGGGKAPAAGWIKELQVRADGLWAMQVEWTPAAREYLTNKEYRYFSPVLRLDPKTRRPLALLHAALTNTPAIQGLEPLIAKMQEGPQGNTENSKQKTDNPSQEAAKAMIEKLKQLLGLMGLTAPADGDETALLALAESKVKEWLATFKQVGAVLALKTDAGVSEIVGAIQGMKAGQDRLTTVETELDALKGELAQGKALAAVDLALKAGKLTPAQKDWGLEYALKDLAGFQAYADKAPVVVPVTDFKVPLKDGKTGTLDQNELAVCRQLGITHENFLAAKQQQAAV